jgi:hypothetical protein
MRALGPGSVSSFLKVILDVARWVLLVSGGFVALAIAAAALLSFNPDLIDRALSFAGVSSVVPVKGAWLGPIVAIILVGAELYLGGLIIIVERLRRIFQTLIMGDPFHPANVRRLRIIGGALAVLELGRYAMAALVMLIARFARVSLDKVDLGVSINLNAWFSVLVIVVLAEVFREGARLRRDAELTI